MISLIKAGAFDELHTDRVVAMERYLNLIADKKKRITLQNMAMLIRKDLIPPQFEFEVKVFNFNKYLKNFKEGEYYCLDAIAMRFFTENYDPDVLVDAVIDEEYDNEIYDLQGRKLETAPSKGVYIRNGKKYK